MGSILVPIVVLLLAAIIAVPFAKRLGIGSIIGYLIAGIVVGPVGFGLIRDTESASHVSELGVVMLLFLIGLELKPARLWIMRRTVFLFGGAQVLVTAALFTGLALLLDFTLPTAVVIGCGLSMSSTALVLPLLAERDLLGTSPGRDGLGVLLFQDLIFIPIVALLPFLASADSGSIAQPSWQSIAIGALCVAAIFLGGRYLVRPLFYLADLVKARELYTAVALLMVIGTALLADLAGLSMSLGAFLAGVMLSDSEYRHEIQADIEPFEGLLLGLFFASMGMSLQTQLLFSAPLVIFGGVIVLLLGKGAVLFVLARMFEQDRLSSSRMAVLLAQGGEFALVLFGFAVGEGILPPDLSSQLSLIVILSMVATPLLFALHEEWMMPRFANRAPPQYDQIEDDGAEVIICGFGRVGQIVGRILRMRGIPFTALDNSAEQVDVIRRFGGKVYFGDSARTDLLRAAGADRAKVIVVAISNLTSSIRVIDTIQRHFPHLRIFARARNRRHAHLLMDRQIAGHVRETLYSSLYLSEQLLIDLGVKREEARRSLRRFLAHDEKTLIEQHAVYQDEVQMIQTSRQAAQELENLLQSDTEDTEAVTGPGPEAPLPLGEKL